MARSRKILVVLAVVLAASPAGASRADAASSGVAALQVGLRAKGFYGGTVDGLWGPLTRSGVMRLQRRAGLRVDGVPGLRTRRALGRLGRPPLGSRALRAGLVGWDVSQLQFSLAWHGFPSGTIDGGFGERTRRAVIRFQRFARLTADGVAGPATFRALRRPIPRSPIALWRPVRAPVTDRFGPRGNRFHAGIDFPASHGAPVFAARPGRVVSARWDSGGFGNLLVIGHGYGVYTWYAHLSRFAVRRGQAVRGGALIGRVGATGYATGPHLHFEVHYRGAAVNPLRALR